MKHVLTVLLLAAGTLAACHDSPAVNGELVTGDHPAPVDTTTVPDTLVAPAKGAVPFVNPTQVGRALGPQSPSPVGSR